MSLINLAGRHRLTPKTRAVRAWTQMRYRITDAVVITFCGLLVAGSGVVTGFIWGVATS